MQITQFLEISKQDIRLSEELTKQLDALVQTDLPQLKAKIAELKEQIWIAYEALRKSQYLQLEDVKEREATLRALNNQIEQAKKDLAQKETSIFAQIALMNQPYLDQVIPMLEQELKHLNSGGENIFRKVDSRKIWKDMGNTETQATLVEVETNAEVINQKRQMLMDMLIQCKNTLLREPLHRLIDRMETFEKSYNSIKVKDVKRMEMSQSMFRDFGGK